MYALTIHQPWAQLIADGVKTMETRSWAPPLNMIGKSIGIHAGKQPLPPVIELEIKKYLLYTYNFGWANKLPFGAVIATATLAEYYYITEVKDQNTVIGTLVPFSKEFHILNEKKVPTDPFGDYSVGRYAWVFKDVKKLDKPVPARGKQKLWLWKE